MRKAYGNCLGITTRCKEWRRPRVLVEDGIKSPFRRLFTVTFARLTTSLLAIAAMGMAVPQNATPAQMAGVKPDSKFATVHLQTNLGSFKSIDGEGRFEVTCAGTILISNLKGKAEVSPGWRKEHESRGRVIYSGKGKIVLTGSWRGFQWFGRDMRAVWYGKGVVRVVGEFDRNLKTGDYWYDDPAKKLPWFSSGVTTVFLPPQNFGADLNAKPVERKRPGG